MSCSDLQAQIQAEHLLKLDEAPAGVVFEIIVGSEDDLLAALKEVQRQTKALRDKFPGLDMAVVSHGREQFALTSNNQNKQSEAHAKVRSLVVEQDIPVHVYAVHASWQGVVPDDFPDYVDVADTGPAQVASYEELGWELIVVQLSD